MNKDINKKWHVFANQNGLILLGIMSFLLGCPLPIELPSQPVAKNHPPQVDLFSARPKTAAIMISPTCKNPITFSIDAADEDHDNLYARWFIDSDYFPDPVKTHEIFPSTATGIYKIEMDLIDPSHSFSSLAEDVHTIEVFITDAELGFLDQTDSRDEHLTTDGILLRYAWTVIVSPNGGC